MRYAADSLPYSVRPRNIESINLHPVTFVVSFQVTIYNCYSISGIPAVAWVGSRACVILAGSWSELPTVLLAVSLWLCYTNRLHLNSISNYLKVGAGQLEEISLRSQVVLELEALV